LRCFIARTGVGRPGDYLAEVILARAGRVVVAVDVWPVNDLATAALGAQRIAEGRDDDERDEDGRERDELLRVVCGCPSTLDTIE
jgi:hypothetical protein